VVVLLHADEGVGEDESEGVGEDEEEDDEAVDEERLCNAINDLKI
jgi:hypothetical protein